MRLIIIEVQTTVSIRSQAHDAATINWSSITKVMREDGINYSIRVLETK